MLLTVAFVAEVEPAVDGNIVVTAAVASMTEEVNLVVVAAVHAVTPVLQGSIDAEVVVTTTLQIDLTDEVVVAFQGNTEVLPVMAQLMAVDIELAVAQGEAVLGLVLVTHSMGAIGVAAVTQCQAQLGNLVVIADVEGVAPCLESVEAALIDVVLVLVLELVNKGVITAQVFADQLPVSNLVADDAKGVVAQGQSCKTAQR